MRRDIIKLAGMLAALAIPTVALAQIPVENIRGKVKSLDGDKLTVATREGRTAIVSLSKDWVVAVLKPMDVSAIKPGSFIGVTEIAKPGGLAQAVEIHVFPPGAKSEEGHYAWDLKPGADMTCGVVTRLTATGAKGHDLEVQYAAGVRHVAIPFGVPAVTMVGGDRMAIKPGVIIFVHPMRAPDGGWTATRVMVGEKGEAPPM